MFCPRCGKPAETGERICTNCGLNLETLNPDSNEATEYQLANIQRLASRLRKVNFRLICFGLIAVSILVFTFLAANKISDSARLITQIRTTEGTTVNEVYYREMGNIYNGYAMFIRECGVFFAAVLVGLGLKPQRK